ncbi:MAG: hypothetical protein QOG64_430 [Acidimicrobiaceae bacterium]|nr:hypothetical protein [Acidimicrobiaceae bacterium]
MSDKPSYLGLLNAIAVGEARAHSYFAPWAEMSPSPEVQSVLRTVAAREGEHGMAFAKRISELGYHVLESDEDPQIAKRMAIVASDCSDFEKMDAMGFGKLDPGKPDKFDNLFTDHSIDIRTAELLGRFIAEERDTTRLLRSCYDQLKAAGAPSSGSGSAAPSDDRLAALESKMDAVCRAVDDLRQVVCAQTITAGAS